MELGVIFGMIVVVFFTLARNRHELRMDDRIATGVAPDSHPDHR